MAMIEGKHPAEVGAANVSLSDQPVCSQCGDYLTSWACGPTHALLRHEAGLEWDGIEP